MNTVFVSTGFIGGDPGCVCVRGRLDRGDVCNWYTGVMINFPMPSTAAGNSRIV